MQSVVTSTEPEQPLITADLIRASYRSDDFPADWTREQRERALDRYQKWLMLKTRHPDARLAPTRDIDLFWHLHMLSPVAYQRDCLRLFGKLLDHDGGYGKDPAELPELKRVFTRTAEWWSTASADGQLWELKCAYEEGLPVLLIYGYSTDRPTSLPDPVHGRRVFTWTWDNISNFIDSL